MKRRQSFVSNSSSASFVIKMSDLTEEQKAILQWDNLLEALKEYSEYTDPKALDDIEKWFSEEWELKTISKDGEEYFVGAAIMDNADLGRVLKDELKLPGYYDHYIYDCDKAFESYLENKDEFERRTDNGEQRDNHFDVIS